MQSNNVKHSLKNCVIHVFKLWLVNQYVFSVHLFAICHLKNWKKKKSKIFQYYENGLTLKRPAMLTFIHSGSFYDKKINSDIYFFLYNILVNGTHKFTSWM